MKKFWSDYCEWGAYLIGIIVAFVIIYYLIIPLLLYVFVFPIIAVIATCIFKVVKHFPKTSILVIICTICGILYNNHIEKLDHQSYEVLKEKEHNYDSLDSELEHCINRIAYCDAKVRHSKENLSYYKEHLKELKSYHYLIKKYKKDIKECSAEKDSLTNLIDKYLSKGRIV